MGEFLINNHPHPVEVEPGTRITDAADAAGILLNTRCGNVGSCGGCAVDLIRGRFDLGGDRGEIEIRDGKRRVLGCQTRILSTDFRISIPARSLVSGGEKVLTSFVMGRTIESEPAARRVSVELRPVSLEDPEADLERLRDALAERGIAPLEPSLGALRRLPLLTREGRLRLTATVARLPGRWILLDVCAAENASDLPLHGLAVDIGTTTVAMALVDLETGELQDAASSYNQQVQRCDDVASRIGYCSREGGLEELHRLVVVDTINKLIRVLSARHGLRCEEIPRMAVSCNTVMSHLFLGISPENIGAIPFNPAANHPGSFRAGDLGIAIHPDAPVDIVPGMYGYVGGDITSDLFVVGAADAEKPVLLIDIGTNGEMVVGDRNGMLACATPAGPAWEGGGLESGVRAACGAVEHVRFDADLIPSVEVVGDAAPNGICGSAYLDFIAEGFRCGLLNSFGRIEERWKENHPRVREITDSRGQKVWAFVLVEASRTEDGERDIVVTEADLSELLKAKAAVFGGTRILLKQAGLDCERLDRIYLAGGFARNIDIRNAIAIGMLPDLPEDRYVPVGNASLAGAWLALVEKGAMQRMARIASHPDVVELNMDPDFETEYVNALLLPNLEESLFPNVMAARARCVGE